MPISLVWTISLLNYDERSKIVVPKDIGKPKFLNKLTGAALGRVPWVPVNPWISKTYAKEPLKMEIKSDSRQGPS